MRKTMQFQTIAWIALLGLCVGVSGCDGDGDDSNASQATGGSGGSGDDNVGGTGGVGGDTATGGTGGSEQPGRAGGADAGQPGGAGGVGGAPEDCGDDCVAKSDLPRDGAPDVPESDRGALANGNNAFAFDLYRALRDREEGNLFMSPYSISVALAMTWAGARGETETEMAETLGFTLPQDQLHRAFNHLDLELAARGEGPVAEDPDDADNDERFRLSVVNSLWGQVDYRFLDPFLDVLAVNYGAGLRLVDFVNETEAARVSINAWVATQTEDRIQDLIPDGVLSTLTRLVLVNAVYFSASWAHVFAEELTHDDTFHGPDGDVIVPMMVQVEEFNYLDGEGFQAVELPYEGQELSMVVFLPDAGELDAFEQGLTAERAGEIIDQLAMTDISLAMPRWSLGAPPFMLKEILTELGMPLAFSPNQADFSGMDGRQYLYIANVVHKAFISVDETGTEASAATAVVMSGRGMPPMQVAIDRPFIYLIRDIKTQTTLFLGRVVDPSH